MKQERLKRLAEQLRDGLVCYDSLLTELAATLKAGTLVNQAKKGRKGPDKNLPRGQG
jgi:hypothetical protein